MMYISEARMMPKNKHVYELGLATFLCSLARSCTQTQVTSCWQGTCIAAEQECRFPRQLDHLICDTGDAGWPLILEADTDVPQHTAHFSLQFLGLHCEWLTHIFRVTQAQTSDVASTWVNCFGMSEMNNRYWTNSSLSCSEEKKGNSDVVSWQNLASFLFLL
jgi:hypothetical protein